MTEHMMVLMWYFWRGKFRLLWKETALLKSRKQQASMHMAANAKSQMKRKLIAIEERAYFNKLRLGNKGARKMKCIIHK